MLASVLDTAISPELIPAERPDFGLADCPEQHSEQTVGPVRAPGLLPLPRGPVREPPEQGGVARRITPGAIATAARWPDLIPPERRNQYYLDEIKQWLAVFLERFFHTSQFKRSAIPNAPKVGSGGSLSPRGDWRAPSDGNATAWLAELEEGLK